MSSGATRYVGLTTLVLTLLLGLQSCGMTTAKPKAEAAVGAFHDELNAGDFDAIWSGADDAFRKATTRESYDRFMQAVHRKLGKALKTVNANWTVRNFNLKTTVVLLQKTDFEHGSGNETFTYVVTGDAVKLVGYNIQSTDLITL